VPARKPVEGHDMAYSERILRQLGNPSGMLGRFVLWRLNRVNSGMNQVALAALALSEGDRVLEIGFGGGALLDEMIVQRKALLVAGAERSQLASWRRDRWRRS
jgi:protein-L-isoaspartate O-methyltransferase